MEIDRVNPEIFGVNIREWPVEAAESRLFLGQDPSGNRLAIKVYPNLTIRQIQTYAEVTNQLAGLVNGSGVTVTLEVQGNANSYSVYITPISILGTLIVVSGGRSIISASTSSNPTSDTSCSAGISFW